MIGILNLHIHQKAQASNDYAGDFFVFHTSRSCTPLLDCFVTSASFPSHMGCTWWRIEQPPHCYGERCNGDPCSCGCVMCR